MDEQRRAERYERLQAFVQKVVESVQQEEGSNTSLVDAQAIEDLEVCWMFQKWEAQGTHPTEAVRSLGY